MTDWMRRLRGSTGLGLAWAVAWAGVGILIGVASRLLPFLPWDAFFRVFDAPLPALAIPGFVAGSLFSMVLGVAARRRRFDQLSLPLFGVLGAVGGLLLSFLPVAVVMVGLGTAAGNIWTYAAVIAAPLTLLSAASAVGTLALAKRSATVAPDDALVPPLLEEVRTPPVATPGHSPVGRTTDRA